MMNLLHLANHLHQTEAVKVVGEVKAMVVVRVIEGAKNNHYIYIYIESYCVNRYL